MRSKIKHYKTLFRLIKYLKMPLKMFLLNYLLKAYSVSYLNFLRLHGSYTGLHGPNLSPMWSASQNRLPTSA
jgi:hypothetical protein